MIANRQQRVVWQALAPLSACAEHLTGWQSWTVIRGLAFHAVFGSIPCSVPA